MKEIVSRAGVVHFRRWQVLKSRWGSVYVHQILRSDEDPDMHDHPFAFVSLVLRGGYFERVRTAEGQMYGATRRPLSIVWHPTSDFHRLKVPARGAWTLVFAGPRTHEPWGYWTSKGWVDHARYRADRHPEDDLYTVDRRPGLVYIAGPHRYVGKARV